MKIYEKRTRPAHEYKHLVSRSCDLCGKKTKSAIEWSENRYEVNETEISVNIKQKEGSNYPEGGNGTEYEVDLCPDCFKDKLVPWLQAQGAQIEKKDWDW
jgi:hypothetical protein